MDYAAFRALFPAFALVTRYPDAALDAWWVMAGVFVKEGWALSGTKFVLAQQLMTAHLAHLATLSATDSTVSGVGGKGTGAVQAASEGGVSVTFVAPPVKSAWQHWLSQSPYGQQLWALLSMSGAGGIYLGGLNERGAFRKAGGTWR